MRTVYVLLALSMLPSITRAQISIEEAKARLEVRQREREKNATSQPAATAAEKPGRQVKKVKRIALKEGAPETVQAWYQALPYYRAQAVKAIEAQIIAKEQEIAQVQRQPLPQVRTGANGLGGVEYAADDAAAKARSNQVRVMRIDLLKLKKQAKQVADDPTAIYVPPMEFEVDHYGQLDGISLKVSQIFDEQNMIAYVGDGAKRVWLTGFKTDGLTDGAPINIVSTVIATGTKKYGLSTLLLVEPLDYTPWIKTVEVDAP